MTRLEGKRGLKHLPGLLALATAMIELSKFHRHRWIARVVRGSLLKTAYRESANARNAKMGRWYLRQLEMAAAQPNTTVFAAPEIERESKRGAAAPAGQVGLVIYLNPELEQLRQLVAGARARLAPVSRRRNRAWM